MQNTRPKQNAAWDHRPAINVAEGFSLPACWNPKGFRYKNIDSRSVETPERNTWYENYHTDTDYSQWYGRVGGI